MITKMWEVDDEDREALLRDVQRLVLNENTLMLTSEGIVEDPNTPFKYLNNEVRPILTHITMTEWTFEMIPAGLRKTYEKAINR